jgi:hypothetical protein
VALHLRPGVRDHYLGWLRSVDADLAAATEARYRGSYLPKADQQYLSRTVRALVASAGGRAQSPRQAREVTGGVEMASPPAPAEQLTLKW